MPTFEKHPETGLRGPVLREYEAPEGLPLKRESTKIYKYVMSVDSQEKNIFLHSMISK